MQTYRAIIVLFILYFQFSCNNYDLIPGINETILITGNIYKNICSRGSTENTKLSIGSQILFNSTGGYVSSNEILFYDGEYWSNSKDFKWNELNKDSLYYTALYPILKENTYDKNTLYENSKLKDILYATGEAGNKDIISLKFSHIFSKLRIILSESIKKDLVFLELTVPYTVELIDTKSLKVSYTEEKQTIKFENDNSSYYELIIPSTYINSISIKLTYPNDTIEKGTSGTDFKPNNLYECRIKSIEDEIGIKSVEDFIIFTKLINNIDYQGTKTLEDFYIEKDGRKIYRLLADLEFTEDECNELTAIGNNTHNRFDDIFDGLNHTIYNLTPPLFESNKYSLFGHLTSRVVIRNIKINNSVLNVQQKSSYVSILSFLNIGLIDNCHISNYEISINQETEFGFIASQNSGSIINCSITNSIVSGNLSTKIGLITASSKGYILNCFTSSNTLTYSSYNSSTYIAGICGMEIEAEKTIIENCYVKCNYLKTTCMYQIIGKVKNSSIKNVFFNNLANTIPRWENSPPSNSNVSQYNEKFYYADGTRSCLDKLNSWIEINQSYYPEFSFKKWIVGNSETPAIFEDPTC